MYKNMIFRIYIDALFVFSIYFLVYAKWQK